MELTILMPCLNEERTVGVCIEKAFKAFRSMGIVGEVVVADNGSTDRSVELAAMLALRAGGEAPRAARLAPRRAERIRAGFK